VISLVAPARRGQLAEIGGQRLNRGPQQFDLVIDLA
jgi:hypothetical protein